MIAQPTDEIKKQALRLARDNKRAEPGIQSIYWVPDTREVRLIEVDPDVAKSLSGAIEPFYFSPSPADGLPSPSGIALIRPDEFHFLRMPDGWGDWDKVQALEI